MSAVGQGESGCDPLASARLASALFREMGSTLAHWPWRLLLQLGFRQCIRWDRALLECAGPLVKWQHLPVSSSVGGISPSSLLQPLLACISYLPSYLDALLFPQEEMLTGD